MSVLFSTQTKLAWQLNQEFYKHQHYVWCSTTFDANNFLDRNSTPPSSTPIEIYRTLVKDAKTEDRNSAKIAQNKVGLLKGASIKRKEGVIDDKQFREIREIIGSTAFGSFLPVIYIIYAERVAGAIQSVEVKRRAHPMSAEYIIPALQAEDFTVIAP